MKLHPVSNDNYARMPRDTQLGPEGKQQENRSSGDFHAELLQKDPKIASKETEAEMRINMEGEAFTKETESIKRAK